MNTTTQLIYFTNTACRNKRCVCTKVWVAMLLMVAVNVFSSVPVWSEQLTPMQEQRYHKLLKELRCLVCQNQSLSESDAGLASDLRDEVHDMVLQDLTDDEIFDFMTSRYGDFVLYRPPFKPQNYVLWIAPFLLLAIGLAVLISKVARRARTEGLDD